MTVVAPRPQGLILRWIRSSHIAKGISLFNVNLLRRLCVWHGADFFGADLVVHSGAKWIDGRGRVLGGVIVGKKALIHDIYLFCRSTGPALSAFNAWVLSKASKTLDVRMERHGGNALHWQKLSEGHHPKIKWLKYPFRRSHPQHRIALKQMKNGGGIVCFEHGQVVSQSGKKFPR